MKAIIYTRTASQKQNGTTLKIQEDLLKKYCANNDIKVVKHFEEICSGLNFNRPEWEKLIESVNKNKVDKILVTSWNRLGRNFDKVNVAINNLKEINVKVISLDNSDFNFINFLKY